MQEPVAGEVVEKASAAPQQALVLLRRGESRSSPRNLPRLATIHFGRLWMMRGSRPSMDGLAPVAVLVPANLVGALVSFTYFTFVDQAGAAALA